ncbi:nitroreductase/quinone reductase family protein [Ruania halotolerans]|uniref:nitroreductase/quinone reductase family protein n=1 Tax=Ruania halotolerans TaxID=2897773 RepID=UPI001E340F5B|nr:nitroreductase/quinone reductase family protein [Ruania halotolerans]UFU06352.1 nitroreductase family deazaflavin-dependent oxidoreductase [Ruania halotolerans]
MPSKPFVPPRWFVQTAWKVHRAIARRGPGRGLWEPGQRNAWGALALTTLGRRSGQARTVIVGYLTDGDRLHTLAMNGWGEGHPAWWFNLRALPEATITLPDGSTRAVVAHRAAGGERERLWAQWGALVPGLDGLAAGRSTPTDVVILTPAAQ